jgi:hypothetical protein
MIVTITGFCKVAGFNRSDSGSDSMVACHSDETIGCNTRALVKLKTDLTDLA